MPSRMRSLLLLALLLGLVLFLVLSTRSRTDEQELLESATSTTLPIGAEPEALAIELVERRPHDPFAFTQGLLLHEGSLFESTGLRGRSSLRQVEPESGKILQKIELEDDYFAEGLERVDDRLIQLTWQSKKAFEYRLSDFSKLGEFEYDTEGWGLCYDGERLIMSDGSDQLFFRDPSTFELEGNVIVTLAGDTINMLNELECVGDDVYANVWQTDQILRIDADSGVVEATIDAAGLLTAEEEQDADVLNGIAYDPASGHFLITGKLWPALFEVRFVPKGE